ncbi:hypothetical protein [Neptunitalea lumnitzerae]|uniref:Uncharacterized protein n=1 Tax=Neptunitalea lumnitzerae TaxID=2965509 RepID=A0ABQ5MIX7_9FLAO|nr:hypothetical protein [Neptunitalea sp. Y10]GLB49371.1 hypothetical protein Y10_17390 [Neptunitalea sp. Y10]
MIDNFVINHSLTNLFEAKVGNGYLIFSTIDLKTNIEKRPAAKQLKNSLLEYMNSKEFKPGNEIDLNTIETLIE